MITRVRIAAMIIENNHLLLVKGSDLYKEFWTPGGKLEKGEQDVDCLKRELGEELSVQLVSAEFFGGYSGISPYQNDVTTTSRVYIAKIKGEIKVNHEIKGYVWMSKKDFYEGKFALTPTTKEKIIPDLIKKNYF